ncbi:MAG: hypothetical protein K2P81_08320, partial [Bacteriovoracaceae bacterium]|nr:hypothetical protein [Bacteriovoracaceae bacterium]
MSVLQTQRNRHEEALLSAFTNGVKPDALLFRQEIRVQQAWAQGLCDLGALSHIELKSIDQALNAAFELMTEGTFEWREEDEDIHMNLERFVNEKTQGLGKKMHLGRSRNDLISTTLKLHVADTCGEVSVLVGKLIEGLVGVAKNNLDILIPGMTHQQNGQPVRWSQVLLGHAWSLHRDQVRLMETKNAALEAMPLGSAALAGTSLSIDLESMAKALGFKSAPQNSYDAVGDRDSVVQIMQNFSLLG